MTHLNLNSLNRQQTSDIKMTTLKKIHVLQDWRQAPKKPAVLTVLHPSFQNAPLSDTKQALREAQQ